MWVKCQETNKIRMCTRQAHHFVTWCTPTLLLTVEWIYKRLRWSYLSLPVDLCAIVRYRTRQKISPLSTYSSSNNQSIGLLLLETCCISFTDSFADECTHGWRNKIKLHPKWKRLRASLKHCTNHCFYYSSWMQPTRGSWYRHQTLAKQKS